MKITDIFYKKSEINSDDEQLFIAESDFNYSGLDILKDSLVYYDGVDTLSVNWVDLNWLDARINPNLLKNSLPLKLDDDILCFDIDKYSNCELELDHFPDMWEYEKEISFIWHKDHIDYNENDLSKQLNVIKSEPKLEFKGTQFSSIYYKFDCKHKELIEYITTSPYKENFGDKVLEIPPFLFIRNYIDFKIFNIIGNIEYRGIKLKGYLQVYKSGIIKGKSAEVFDAIICNKEGFLKDYDENIVEDFTEDDSNRIKLSDNYQFMRINKGQELHISLDGNVYYPYSNSKAKRYEYFRLEKKNQKVDKDKLLVWKKQKEIKLKVEIIK